MKDWYLRQSPRDRMILLGLGTLALLVAAWLLLWEPAAKGSVRIREALESKQETLDYLRQGEVELAAMQGGLATSRSSNKQPYLLIDEIIRDTGLNSPERVEPSNNGNGARVQFAEVEFDKLVLVLAELEQYGLVVTQMNLARKGTGLVSARFSMEKS